MSEKELHSIQHHSPHMYENIRQTGIVGHGYVDSLVGTVSFDVCLDEEIFATETPLVIDDG